VENQGQGRKRRRQGRIFTKLAKEIMVAARKRCRSEHESTAAVGGRAGEEKPSMPKDTLERAIQEGAGLMDEA